MITDFNSEPVSTLTPYANSLRLVHESIPDGGILTLPLPEDIAFGVNSTWESFSEGNLIDFVNKIAPAVPIVGKPAALAYETATRATNSNAYISSFSHQTWRGTGPLEFQLKITLSAYSSAKTDVMDKLQALTKLSLPSGNREINGKIEGEALKAVRLVDANASLITAPPRDIGLYLGASINLPAVVIPFVNISFETRADAKGDFIFATADIGIKSSYTPNSQMFLFKSFSSPKELDEQRKLYLGQTGS